MSSKPFTSKSDVYSFGVVLWEFFELGKVPFAWLSNKDVWNVVPYGEKLPRPRTIDCPDELFQLMNACWQGQPENRPSFVEVTKQLKLILKIISPQTEIETEIEITPAQVQGQPPSQEVPNVYIS